VDCDVLIRRPTFGIIRQFQIS